MSDQGKKYKVKPKNIIFCNIRYLGQHLLLPCPIFFSIRIFFSYLCTLFYPIEVQQAKIHQKSCHLFCAVTNFKMFLSYLAIYVMSVKKNDLKREKCFHNRNPFYFNLGGERGRTIHQVSISAKWTSQKCRIFSKVQGEHQPSLKIYMYFFLLREDFFVCIFNLEKSYCPKVENKLKINSQN